MPDFLQKDNGDMDWNKFFMSIAVAVVFVMQAYSQMQHNDTKQFIEKMDEKVVPRPEIENTYVKGKELVSRSEFLEMIRDLQNEIDRLAGEEERNENK